MSENEKFDFKNASKEDLKKKYDRIAKEVWETINFLRPKNLIICQKHLVRRTGNVLPQG